MREIKDSLSDISVFLLLTKEYLINALILNALDVNVLRSTVLTSFIAVFFIRIKSMMLLELENCRARPSVFS